MKQYWGRDIACPARLHVRPGKAQIRLRGCTESLQGTLCVDKDPKCLHVDSEEFEKLLRMHMLISVLAGRTCNLGENAVPRLNFYYKV